MKSRRRKNFFNSEVPLPPPCADWTGPALVSKIVSVLQNSYSFDVDIIISDSYGCRRRAIRTFHTWYYYRRISAGISSKSITGWNYRRYYTACTVLYIILPASITPSYTATVLPDIDNNRVTAGKRRRPRCIYYYGSPSLWYNIHYNIIIVAKPSPGWKFSSYLICLVARTSHRWRWSIRCGCNSSAPVVLCGQLYYTVFVSQDLCREYGPSLVRNLTNMRW